MQRSALIAALIVASSAHADPADPGKLTPPAQRAALNTWLRKLLPHASALSPTDVTLEPAPKGMAPPTPLEAVTTVSITEVRTMLDGRPMKNGMALARALGEKLELARRYRNTRNPVVVLDIAGDAPWSAVVSAASSAVEAGIGTARIRFAGVAVPLAFSSTPIDAVLQKAATEDTSQRAQALAGVMRTLFSECPAAQKGLGKIGELPSEDRTAGFLRMLETLPEAPACKIDAPSLQGITTVMVGRTPLRSIDVRLAPANPRVIAAEASTKWRDVLKEAPLGEILSQRGRIDAWFVAR